MLKINYSIFEAKINCDIMFPGTNLNNNVYQRTKEDH